MCVCAHARASAAHQTAQRRGRDSKRQVFEGEERKESMLLRHGQNKRGGGGASLGNGAEETGVVGAAATASGLPLLLKD